MTKSWERRYEQQKKLREYKREQSAKRAELRPLRTEVNKALKSAGIKHSVTHYSSSVKGWPLHTTEGWKTESVYWDEPKYIRVEINIYQSSSSKDQPERREDLHKLALIALQNFKYEKVGDIYQVYSVK